MHQNTRSVAFLLWQPTIPQALSPQEQQPPALVMLHFSVQAKEKRLGRPRKAVDRAKIATLRSQSCGWKKIAAQLGVGVGTVLRADKEAP